jgi:hypothetical protein
MSAVNELGNQTGNGAPIAVGQTETTEVFQLPGNETIKQCIETDSDIEGQIAGSEEQMDKCCWCQDYDLSIPQTVKNDDRVLIRQTRGEEEVLIYPSEQGDDWIQEHVINKFKDRDKVLYAKNDALKLEKFLSQEQNNIHQIIKRKCLLHSARCETCDILSRQDQRKENRLIQQTWRHW